MGAVHVFFQVSWFSLCTILPLLFGLLGRAMQYDRYYSSKSTVVRLYRSVVEGFVHCELRGRCEESLLFCYFLNYAHRWGCVWEVGPTYRLVGKYCKRTRGNALGIAC